MKPTSLLKAATILGLSLSLFSSCKKQDNLAIKANVAVFKPEIFKQKLQASLSDANGYGFVITQNKQIAATAEAGTGSQGSTGAKQPYSIDKYINIASVTKTLTATTFLKFMALRPFTLDSTIGPWLPEVWTKNGLMRNITFRQLLTHTSGIRSSGTDWATLKSIIAAPPEGNNTRTYSNINLALFRAMLPKMNNLAIYNTMQGKPTAEFEQWMSERYIMIVQDNIFKRIDLENRACVPLPGNTIDMFNEDPNAVVSRPTGDWTNSCGGGGFYLTTRDLSKFIVYLANTEEFLTEAQKTPMDAERLGWWQSLAVKNGTAYGHDGALYSDLNGDSTVSKGDVGLQTLIMKFPNSVEVAITVNSVGNGWRNLYNIAVEAYNDSFEL